MMTAEEILREKIRITTSLVEQLESRGLSVTSNCRDWALRAVELRELGMAGSELYHRLSQMDSNYDHRGTTANFQSACRKEVGSNGQHRSLRSFFHLCRDLGLQMPTISADVRADMDSDKAPRLYVSMPKGSYMDSIWLLRTASTRSQFCQSLVSEGLLTEEQMQHAAERYHLGARMDESVIFWQVDEQGRLCDGKVMFYDEHCHRLRDNDHRVQQMSYLMKFRMKDEEGTPLLPRQWQGTRCLFGQHLLGTVPRDVPVAIVESEKTAVILSELFPEALFLASGGESQLSVALLMPLKGRRIILFPDTDVGGNTHRLWTSIAQQAAQALHHPITVSDLLERYATPEQKERKIDLVDTLAPPQPLP